MIYKNFNYLIEKRRMLDSLGRTDRDCNGVDCKECPLSRHNSKKDVNCYVLEMEHPMLATAIVGTWFENHPRKTYKDELLEKYPNACILEDGTPGACLRSLGIHARDCDENCYRCWEMEVPNED